MVRLPGDVPREGVMMRAMTPSEYEALVADHYVRLGYEVENRPGTNDWGIDVIATKDAERIAVQVKKYGGTTRPVNRAQMMELYGAATFFDCTRAVLATDGRVMADAEQVASKLGIEILRLSAGLNPSQTSHPGSQAGAFFDDLWARYVMPLAGTTLVRSGGTSNTIVAVDWAGVERVTSNGRRQRIKIEIFRYAVNRMQLDGRVARAEINAMYPGRASSGVILILSQIPDFEYAGGELRRRR